MIEQITIKTAIALSLLVALMFLTMCVVRKFRTTEISAEVKTLEHEHNVTTEESYLGDSLTHIELHIQSIDPLGKQERLESWTYRDSAWTFERHYEMYKL